MQKIASIKALQYFVGKVCTVFIGGSLNRSFSDQQFTDYFVGVVESITPDAVFTSHPVTGCRNYYPLTAVIGICEEQVLDPGKPEEAEFIQELKQQGVQPNLDLTRSTESPFTDIDVLADLDTLAGVSRQAIEARRKK
jgi:hypothetical protein